jgi:uncharacterized protein
MDFIVNTLDWIIQNTTVYLPIAGIEFNIIILLAIGLCVGILGGFFGVGGAWIVTPALMIFKMPAPFAIGTDLAHIMGKSIVSTRKHWKMGNVDWKLGIISNIGTVIGVETGAQLIMILKNMGGDIVGTSVRYTYIVLLMGLGSFMLYDYFVIRKRKAAGTATIQSGKKSLVQKIRDINIPPFMSFEKSGIDKISIWIIIFIFFFTGFLSGYLGVGGGFIRMPALIYLIGCPTAIAVGTDLFVVLLDGAYGCFTYGMKGTVEILAAIIMLMGAAVGAQIGVTAVKYIKGYGIRLLFAIMILFAGLSIILSQIYNVTKIAWIDTASAIVIMGASIMMSSIIFVKLVKAFKKEKEATL